MTKLSKSKELEIMELEEPQDLICDNGLVSAVLEAHAARTRLLFPADRIEALRAAAVARGAVVV